jgi:hypothetical protein|tara:strand:+ start:2168 stop:2776 length:609 start_codon:yes stop_codon:yes gene_type:complete
MTDDQKRNNPIKNPTTNLDFESIEVTADSVQADTPSLAQDSAKTSQKSIDTQMSDAQAVLDAPKEVYLHYEDGSLPEYDAKPKWKTAEKIIHGIVIGRGDSKRVIELDTVRKLAHLNLSYKDMADFFGCRETTFRDNFRFVVEQGRQKTKHRLMEAMLTNAIEKMNPVMQIWLSKNLLGFQDAPNNTDNNVTLPWVDGDDDD